MVLFVGFVERNIEVLREWGERADVAYLDNAEWRTWDSLVMFKSNKPKISTEQYMDLEIDPAYTAIAVPAAKYFSMENRETRLSINKSYYMYRSWCEPLSLPTIIFVYFRICRATNAYGYGIRLKRPPSLFTIVLTQTSTII